MPNPESPKMEKNLKNREIAHRCRIIAAMLALWALPGIAATPALIQDSDLGPEQRLQSKAILEEELDWLDSLLDDGREFFAGSSFSRADISVASLLSPLVLPDEHPVYANMTLPPLMQQEIKIWQQRPTLRWISRMYQTYR